MLQQKMQKNYLTFKLFVFLLFIISLDAMEGFENLGFESPAEQFSLIAQKNKETIFENIEYYYASVFPTPPTAFLVSLPFTFLAALLSTATGFGPDKVAENGLFKNWGLLTKNLIILYATNPLFVCGDFPSLLYSFIRINQNKQEYEYQYNRKIKSINNNNCDINAEILNYPPCSNTSEKIKNFLFREGRYLRGEGIWLPAIRHITKTIIFNNHEENENIEDELPENNIENEEGEDIEDSLDENNIEHVLYRTSLVINNKKKFTKIKLSLNETTKIGYYQKDRFYCKKFFILDSSTNNTCPFLPNEAVIDVQITPDKTILIAITPIKTIKIDLTKSLDITKAQLEKSLCLKNRKEKAINLMGKGIWTLFFLCYSQWWLKYFCHAYISQDIKKVGLLLETHTSVLPSLLLNGIKSIIAAIKNVKLKNSGEFLFGKSNE